MGFELGGKPIPKTFEKTIFELRDRIKDLVKKYGSLSRWGRPYFFSLEEIAVVYYINERIGVSLDRLSKYLGIDKTSMYKLVRKINEEGRVSYYDLETKQVKVEYVTPQQLLDIAESKLEAKAKEKITDPFQSTIVKEFFEKDIPKRAKVAGKPAYLSLSHKKETLRYIRTLMEYFKDRDYPTNPDLWEEKEVEKALWDILKDYKKVARAMIALRRIPQWNNWFKGKIGAVTKRITPKLSALFYEDYIKLKKLWREGKLSDGEFLTIWLHITTGAREGYTLYSDKEDLDNAEVKSSITGLKWENLTKVGDTYIIKIYESKTEKPWTCDLSWLDREPLEVLLKYAKEKGSIIKTITGCKTVGDFRKWYIRLVKKVSKLLELPYKLTPHDMRRSHISILAEFGVPMEYALSGHMDFGVGWEDAKTALVFYLRFSKFTKQMIMNRIESVKKQIETQVVLQHVTSA